MSLHPSTYDEFLARKRAQDKRKREAARRYQEKREERARKEGEWSSLERTGPVNPVNPERRREARERDFGDKADWIRTLPCDTCGAPPPSDPSHYPTRAAGGTKRDLLPQCRTCHNELGRGVETFQRTHDVDLSERTAHYERRWQERVA